MNLKPNLKSSRLDIGSLVADIELDRQTTFHFETSQFGECLNVASIISDGETIPIVTNQEILPDSHQTWNRFFPDNISASPEIESAIIALLSNYAEGQSNLIQRNGKTFLIPGLGNVISKLDKNFKNLNPMTALYNSDIYSTAIHSIPPAERQRHVAVVEAQIGCEHNACTFCNLYDLPYRVKEMEEIVLHFEEIQKALGDYAPNIQRAFVQGADALSIPLDILVNLLGLIDEKFKPRRTGGYVRSRTLLSTDLKDLRKLRKNGLGLVYLGTESGSDQLLHEVSKGITAKENIEASRKAKKAGYTLSTMIILGLGGKKHQEEHAQATAYLLNKTRPHYVTFLGINPSPKSVYSRKMTKSNNRPLTDVEILA